MEDFKSVMQMFPNAQMVGGRVIVYHNGKHVELGLTRPATGVFSLTEEGLLLVQEMRSNLILPPVTSPRKRRAEQVVEDAPAVEKLSGVLPEIDALSE